MRGGWALLLVVAAAWADPYVPPATPYDAASNEVARDARHRIKRDAKAVRAFRRANPCPATGRVRGPCPGYVVDHVRALRRGGQDHPANMQWQTVAAARAKDRRE